ncbi:MAG: CoA-binding protein [Endomicrobium sp.]|jgi:predicted CoA-binding protein|nr:CoA-binding protein [Endomicrobium sp.]
MKNKITAVVGVSVNPEKFGYKIFDGLIKSGYKVFAVGVKGGQLFAEKIYANLADLPCKPDIVITVVPPAATEKTVDDCIDLGIKEIWMQPGSNSEKAAQKARAAGIKVTTDACFMKANKIW